jgi:hypothetical protein
MSTEEYQGEKGHPTTSTPQPHGLEPTESDIVATPIGDGDYWARLAKRARFESVEACRDAMDHPNWRIIEARKEVVRRSRERPARTVDGEVGYCPGKGYRQINVKLSPADFDGVLALASERDVRPSTMARMLIRRAIGDALGVAEGPSTR